MSCSCRSGCSSRKWKLQAAELSRAVPGDPRCSCHTSTWGHCTAEVTVAVASPVPSWARHKQLAIASRYLSTSNDFGQLFAKGLCNCRYPCSPLFIPCTAKTKLCCDFSSADCFYSLWTLLFDTWSSGLLFVKGSTTCNHFPNVHQVAFPCSRPGPKRAC